MGVRDLKSAPNRSTPIASVNSMRKETGCESREHGVRPGYGFFAQAAVSALRPALPGKLDTNDEFALIAIRFILTDQMKSNHFIR